MCPLTGDPPESPLTISAAPIEVDIVPEAPTTVTAEWDSSTNINVVWTTDSQAANGYDILRSYGGADFSLIATVDAGTTSYDDDSFSNPDDNSEYTLVYEVEAVGDSQNDLSSPLASNVVNTDLNTPTLRDSAASDGADSVNLTWDYMYAASGFEIQMADETLGQAPYLQSTPDFNDGYGTTTIDDLNAGDTYYFWIRADFSDVSFSPYNQVSYIVPDSSDTPDASPPSFGGFKERLTPISTSGTYVFGDGTGEYGLFDVDSGSSSFGGLNLGEWPDSRGEVVAKGGSLTVSGSLDVGQEGYGSFTNGGATVTIGGGLSITGLGVGSTHSYFNQIAGSTTVSVLSPSDLQFY